MKIKQFLLTALIALVGGGSSWAAESITSGTKYYIQNVESGLFLCGANSWGTQGTVSTQGEMFTVTLNNGTYTLTNTVVTSGNKTFGYNLYVDTNTSQNGNTWTIAPVDGKPGVFTIYGRGKKDNTANSFDGYVSQSATEGGHIGFVAGSVNDPANTSAQWRFLTKEEAIAQLSEVTELGDSKTVSFLLENPNFTRNHNTAKWIVSSNCTNKNLAGGDNGNMCAESYHSPFTVSQTLEGIPNGIYGVTAQGFVRSDNGGNVAEAMFFANEATKVFPVKTGTENSMADASNSFKTGAYTIDEIMVKVTDGQLEVGVKNTSNSLWCIWDNFEVTYYGNHEIQEVILAEYVKAYNKAMTTATALLEEDMTEEAKTALSTAISSNTITPATATQEQLEAATANLNNAIQNAQIAIAKQAKKNKIAQLITEGGDNTDLTSVIENPSFETSGTAGWTVFNSMNVITANDNIGGKDGKVYIEAWQPATAGDYGVEQIIEGFPEGIYTLTVLGHARSMDNAYIYANDEKTAFSEDKTENFSVSIYLQEPGSLTIGAKCTNTATANRWLALDNFRLTYVGADFPELTPATGKMNAEVAAAQTTAITTFTNNKNFETYKAAVAAIDAAQKSADMYTASKIALENQKTLIDGTNVYSNGWLTGYVEDYNSLLQKYNENVLNEAVVNPNAATGWHASTAYNDLLTPWTFDGEACSEFTKDLHINTWSTEGDADGSNFQVPFFEFWIVDTENLPNKTLATKVTGLENGHYSVSAWVRVRAKNEVAATEATGITLTANNGTPVDVTNGAQVGTTQFTLAEVTAQGVVIDGTLNIKFNIDNANISWLSYKNVKYTRTGDLTDEEQKESDIATVINKADCDNNEPWPGGGRTVETMKAYDGVNRTVFSSNTYATPGYKVGQRSQQVTLPYTGTYKLTAFVKIPATTGFVNISVDDLVQKTVYGTEVKSMNTVDTNGAKTETVNDDAQGWVASEMYFNANEGDKKTIYLNISKGNGDKNVDYAYLSGLKLEYAEEGLEIALGETGVNPAIADNTTAADVTVAKAMKTGKLNTLCVPFSMDKPANWTVLELTSVSSNEVNFTEASSIEAGKGYLVQVESDENSVQASNVTVNLNATTESAADGYKFVGTLAATKVPVGSYVLQTQNGEQKFFVVAEGKQPTVNAFKAYLTAPASAAGKASFSIGFADDDNATAVDAINALVEGKAEIYTIVGVKLQKLQKGLNIVNGVPVMVK